MKTRAGFEGKKVAITGAASGIGLETARAFARRGAKLALADVNGNGLSDARRELESAGGEVKAYVVDVTSAEEMRAFCDDVFHAMGRVDVLCNNAGVAVGGSFEDIGLEDWEWILGANLMGVIHGCHFFYPRMIAQGGGGHIVNVASAAGLFPLPGSIPYTCTKYAVVGFSETLRAEAAQHGIGVSAICPAFVVSGIFDSARQCTPSAGMSRQEATEEWMKRLRRLGRTPDKVAAAVLDAVERNRGVVVCFSEARICDLFHRLSRRAYGAFAARAVVIGRKGMEGK
ncbi:MAG: SDR family NAD(P)-dependent oxidoreductase [Actinomycetota bacterium]|nr:SDR family NAD(P)-dependent oxidoreductase [Actinomycetota bacterium]MDD5666985.1 SDR family NAD(P)-dependent oxidoreductase [Actinomycetota bacterium]